MSGFDEIDGPKCILIRFKLKENKAIVSPKAKGDADRKVYSAERCLCRQDRELR